MLLEGSSHDLSLCSDLPDSDFTAIASRNNLLAVVGWGEGCHTVIVRVIDGVQQTARLRQERPDLAIAPSREDAASIVHEFDSVALEAWNLNSEQLLSGLGVPDTDVVDGARRKQVGVASREGNIVDAVVVASVTELGRDRITVAPVDCGLGGAGEEVSRVSSDGDRGASAHDLVRALLLHVLGADLKLGNFTVTRANQKVTVCKKL